MKTSLKRRLTQGLAITLPGLVLAGALTGCATPPPKSDTADYQAYQQRVVQLLIGQVGS